MADEFFESVQVKLNDGAGYVQQTPAHSTRSDLAAADPQVEFWALTVPTAGVTLSFTKITTPGILVLTNLEAAGGNNVEYGRTGDTKFLELRPQETHKIRLKSGESIDLAAITADVRVQVEAFEN